MISATRFASPGVPFDASDIGGDSIEARRHVPPHFFRAGGTQWSVPPRFFGMKIFLIHIIMDSICHLTKINQNCGFTSHHSVSDLLNGHICSYLIKICYSSFGVLYRSLWTQFN